MQWQEKKKHAVYILSCEYLLHPSMLVLGHVSNTFFPFQPRSEKFQYWSWNTCNKEWRWTDSLSFRYFHQHLWPSKIRETRLVHIELSLIVFHLL